MKNLEWIKSLYEIGTPLLKMLDAINKRKRELNTWKMQCEALERSIAHDEQELLTKIEAQWTPEEIETAKALEVGTFDDPPLPFTVAAGRYEAWDGVEERNYKYIESFATMHEAFEAWTKCRGYPFSEIEYTTPDGKTFILNLEPKQD